MQKRAQEDVGLPVTSISAKEARHYRRVGFELPYDKYRYVPDDQPISDEDVAKSYVDARKHPLLS